MPLSPAIEALCNAELGYLLEEGDGDDQTGAG